MTQNYNILVSFGSRTAFSGYGKISLVCMDATEIISIAEQQAGRCGYDLTEHADIEWVGVNPNVFGGCDELKMSRDWHEGEELDAALAELTQDGHLYEIFKCGEGDADFIARAADFNLENEAIAFVD